MKKIRCLWIGVLAVCGCLCGCAYSKDEVLGQYNNILQFAGDFQLTGNFSLAGKRKYGVDHYTGEYTAEYKGFSKTEYLFGGTSIDREYGKDITVYCRLTVEEGEAEVFWMTGSEEPVVLLSADGYYEETLTLPEGGNYIGITGERFTGEVDIEIE